jgi:hypothetical protein
MASANGFGALRSKTWVLILQMVLESVWCLGSTKQSRLCAKLIIWCCGAEAQFPKLIKQMSLVGKMASVASRVEFHAEGGWARV